MRNKKGQALVEYAFIIALVVIVVVAIVIIFGAEVKNLYQMFMDKF